MAVIRKQQSSFDAGTRFRRRSPIFHLYWIRRLAFVSILVCLLILGLQPYGFSGWQQAMEMDHDILDAPDGNPAAKEIKSTKPKYKVFQVMNTFAINKGKPDDPIHQPFDQWSTLESIARAKRHAPEDMEITLVCAMFESDWNVLTQKLVPTCDQRFLLERSTITEYARNSHAKQETQTMLADAFSKRELPFLQDLLDAAVSVARKIHPKAVQNGTKVDGDNGFYIMLTNSDIGLTKGFYDFLLPELKKGRKAFTINRWSIPMENNDKIRIRKPTDNREQVQELLSQIDASLPTGKSHPGFDCFLIHSSVIDQIRLGNLFAGFPPWGSALQLILQKIVARDSYQGIVSNPNATFHLGDKGTWSKKKVGSQTVQDFLKDHHQKNIADCPKPIFSQDPHTLLNTANCGHVFRDNYHWPAK